MQPSEKYETTSADETFELGKKFGSEAVAGSVYALDGDLGAGKTVFAKGFASAMAIEEITSPTFNVIKEYIGELPMYHMDVYRTNGKIDNLGLEKYFTKGGVTIIEWAEMIEDHLPKER